MNYLQPSWWRLERRLPSQGVMRSFGFFSGVITILFTLSAGARDFYVRAGASGANNGSDWNNAWRECNNIVWGGAGVNAGDTVWIAGGTYTTTMTPGVSGNANAWVSIKRVLSSDPVPTSAAGWNSAYDSQVIIGGSADALDFNITGLSYIIVDGRTDFGMTLITPNSDGNSISFNK